MKKILGITFGGLQRRAIGLVLSILVLVVAVFAGVTAYQNRMLAKIVNETRIIQQQAISQASEETMHQMLSGSMIRATALEANAADTDFAEVINNTLMLQTMAQGLFENRDSMEPASFSLPDPAMDGVPSAMVLCEEGVDYTQSKDLGVVAHMSAPMIAMLRNSDKIDGCYIGLADGTDLCVDEKPAIKLDENGKPIPFPVRERPWYRGAAESGGVYFTGIEADSFSGKFLVTCSAPVMVKGELVGVVGIDIILESVDDVLESASQEAGSVLIINEKGQIILSSDLSGLFPYSKESGAQSLTELGIPALTAFVEQALSEQTGLCSIMLNGKDYYVVGAPMPAVGWAVVTAVEKDLTEQPEKLLLAEYDRINEEASAKFKDGSAKTNLTTIAVIALVFLIGSGAALLAVRKMVKPIEEMTRDIANSGMTGKPFAMKDSYRTNDEIELLAESFDDLSKKVRNYISQLTQITAEKERINTELSVATKIQAAMMPHIFPPYPERSEIDIYASMDPAKEVGGDFYDFFLVDDDHLCMVMADVSGKGVPAALFMMASKIILQSVAMLGGSPAEILTKTNQAICSNNQEEMFITVWVGILEISTGRLTAANAGHEYPALKQPDGSFELIKDKHGLVIGAMDGVKYKEYEWQLKPGTKLFVYTDGVPEAMDAANTLFGTERMIAALNEVSDGSTKDILKQVRSAVDQFVDGAEQFDDLTMLCMEYKGPKPTNELTLEASAENLSRVQTFVEERLEAAECPMKAQMQIGVAVEEIFVNIASYAYAPNKGEATVRVEHSEDPASVTITFIDSGTPYDPLKKADPDVALPAEEREIGGLGIFMTKKLMDDVTYEYRDGRNILTLKKKY